MESKDGRIGVWPGWEERVVGVMEGWEGSVGRIKGWVGSVGWLEGWKDSTIDKVSGREGGIKERLHH